MIIIQTTINGLEMFVLLVNDTEQRGFTSHAGALTAAQDYVI
jgi:hypothetical protein